MSDINYWVIQRYKGELYLHDYYKSKASAESRADRISGGEVFVFGSFSTDPEGVRGEFIKEELKDI